MMTAYRVAETAARHTCWDIPMWDGTMQADCLGCAEARANPCRFCGYGHVFTTHNDEPHHAGGDLLIPIPPTDEWYSHPHLYDNREGEEQ